MFLKHLKLINFRNFEKSEFFFSSHLTVIIGENARGKTNLLESLYFFMNGVGFRETREEELIKFEEKESSVEGSFNGLNLKIVLLKKDSKVEKKYYISKVKKRHIQYLSEQTKAILFSPEQLKIITDSPNIRRSYFDKQISFYDFEYRKRVSNYENALRRRNKILEHYKNEEKLKEELKFWNEYLVKQATYITKKRQEYIDYLNSNPDIVDRKFRVEYKKSEMSERQLNELFEKEKIWRRTLIGPQKDDFIFYLNSSAGEKNVHHFGSRSEQRMVIMWLKLNEVNFFEKTTKKKPIILLDDVFSEFDTPNKKLILSLVKKYQSIVTTTEKEIIDMVDVEKKVIEL